MGNSHATIIKNGLFLFRNSKAHPVTDSHYRDYCYLEDSCTVSMCKEKPCIAVGRVERITPEGVLVWVEK